MIYYPMSVLMLAGVRDILIISTPEDLPNFKRLLGSGRNRAFHCPMPNNLDPKGRLAQAYIIGAEFVEGHKSVLVLGDNIFYGHGLTQSLLEARKNSGAAVFAYHVSDPERYGVVEFDARGFAVSLEEKPKWPRSHSGCQGLYFYDERAPHYARELKPSPRGELEITDLNRIYLKNGDLNVQRLGRGFVWLDTGTPASLLEAAEYVRAIEQRQGQRIACLEEIAYQQGWITADDLRTTAKALTKSGYGTYLLRVLEEHLE